MHLSLAPLQGTTEFPFRNVWVQHFTGLDSAYTPFIPLVTGIRVKPAHIRDAIPSLNNSILPVIPQIIGKRHDSMVLMAHAFADLGYSEMNWNLGCPSSIVVKKKHGSGMLPFPQIIRSILEQITPVIPIGLSIKMRAGLNSPDELLPVLNVLNDFPIQKIILHPRLGIDLYTSKPEHIWFAEALKHSVHPLVYNGDINQYEDFQTLKNRFPYQNEWMVGRGILKNPFLPSILKGDQPPETSQKREKLYQFTQHLNEALAANGITEKRLLSKLKEYWSYFSGWFCQDQSLWCNIRQTQTMPTFNHIVSEAFKTIDLKQ